MRAFLVGLTFLAALVILAGIWFLLFPLLLLMGLLLRFMLVCVLAIIGIWLLGKLIIFVWGKLNQQKNLHSKEN